jgi:hypothetical protein
MSEYCCVSVLGGWQTEIKGKEEKRIGPVFNEINDLWNWQRENLYNDDIKTELDHAELEARLC